MSTAATLVLKDRLDVNVNYSPMVIKTGEYAKYVDRTQGVLALQSTAALAYSESKTHRKVSGTVMFPVLNATTGLVEPDYYRFESSTHLTHDANARLDLRKRGAAFAVDAVVTGAMDNGDTPW